MTLTPSVRAISLCSFPCVARSFACASLDAISTLECFFFLAIAHNGTIKPIVGDGEGTHEQDSSIKQERMLGSQEAVRMCILSYLYYLSGLKPRMHSFEAVWWNSCYRFKYCAMHSAISFRAEAHDSIFTGLRHRR